jgi:hypothetical protein
VTKRYEPLIGARLRAIQRTNGLRIKDSALERHGFGAACVVVHRSNIREWHPPGPNSPSNIPVPYSVPPSEGPICIAYHSVTHLLHTAN